MRNYLKEEEFVGEFYNWAAAASKTVNYEWHPNENCNNAVRKQINYFIKSGEATQLNFSSASVHRPPNEPVYAQVTLESSSRIVTIWVSSPGREPITKILVDRRK